MCFLPHVRACVLPVVVGLCSMAYGQSGTPTLYLIQTERDIRSRFCYPSRPAAAEFSLGEKPAERYMRLNGWFDGLPRAPEKTLPWQGRFEEVRCPKGCQICGTVYAEDIPVHFCTKG